MMNHDQLNRLRLVESELLHLRRQVEQIQVRIYQLHDVAVEMLNQELAAPLSAPMQ